MAIRAALGEPIASFARRHGFAPSNVSACLHWWRRHEKIRRVLADELGVDVEWLGNVIEGRQRARN